jgi:hypothetical protein
MQLELITSEEIEIKTNINLNVIVNPSFKIYLTLKTF